MVVLLLLLLLTIVPKLDGACFKRLWSGLSSRRFRSPSSRLLPTGAICICMYLYIYAYTVCTYSHSPYLFIMYIYIYMHIYIYTYIYIYITVVKCLFHASRLIGRLPGALVGAGNRDCPSLRFRVLLGKV